MELKKIGDTCDSVALGRLHDDFLTNSFVGSALWKLRHKVSPSLEGDGVPCQRGVTEYREYCLNPTDRSARCIGLVVSMAQAGLVGISSKHSTSTETRR